jgi:hypothetical protein
MANTVIYGTAKELESIKTGQWDRRMVKKLDKMLSAAGCSFCDSTTIILQRTYLNAAQSAVDEPEEVIVISCACLECRSSWPIEYHIGAPPEAN